MKRFAMGWLSDRADFRDHTPADSGIARKLKSAAFPKGAKAAPKSVDLRPWCSPVEDQGDLGSCTAQAGAGLLEYYWLRANGELLDISRLFLYRTTRRLMGWNGDTGAFLRDTMKAMVVFGVPPEQYWPYAIARFDDEPEAFCYAFAQNFKSLEYYRLDPPGTSAADLLARVKTPLAAGTPSMFGFWVYLNLWNEYSRRIGESNMHAKQSVPDFPVRAIAYFLVLCALAAFVQPVQALCATQSEEGSWINSNSSTNSLTRAELRFTCQDQVLNGQPYPPGPPWHVHLWGKCIPTDCDWREIGSQEVRIGDRNYIRAIYYQGFATRYVYADMSLYRAGQLWIWMWTDFSDPGRPDYASQNWFIKQ